VPLNRLFLFTLLFAFAIFNVAIAEENVEPNSHLPYAALEPVTVSTTTPELTSATEIKTPPNTYASIDPTVSLPNDDLWQRIRHGFAMHELDSKLIAKHEQWYAHRPDYVARMTDRAKRYLFYITEEIERRGMPSEIALLPMIESAFNPGANSIAKASGIWQFIPSTGKNFGLQQNWWFDERRDVISATNGALDYLQKLHDMFDDWELALAAYNWGEGAVARAQAKNRRLGKATNFSSLKLPPETQNYVPKLLAIKNIINDPARFNLQLAHIPNQPYFAAVATSRAIDVKLAAEMANISLDEFKALNPSHNRPVILQDESNLILLPIDKLETFQTNLENCNQRLVSWQPYQTKKGEHFDLLAPRFGLSATQLRSVNGLSARAKISNGQTLLVPATDTTAGDGEFTAFNTHLVTIDESVGTRMVKHTVRKGDTLASIAKRYRVSPAKLKEWNIGLNKLAVGQRVTIVQAVPQVRKTKLAKMQKRGNTKVAQRKNIKLAHNKPQKVASSKRPIKVASTR
jgi:membrane-bound lytic murein transglycosylase D